MDALVVKCSDICVIDSSLIIKGSNTSYVIHGTITDLHGLVLLLSYSCSSVEAGLDLALKLLSSTGKTEFQFNEIKDRLITEICYVVKRIDDTNDESWYSWCLTSFDNIDFDQEVDSWAERLPK